MFLSSDITVLYSIELSLRVNNGFLHGFFFPDHLSQQPPVENPTAGHTPAVLIYWSWAILLRENILY